MPVGRFAPSPTGPLHMGSLVTALASYLDIKKLGGSWHVRIDNIDPPRELAEATTLITNSLDAHGLIGEFVGESARLHHTVSEQNDNQFRYNSSLQQLNHDRYYCNCTRASLRGIPIYPGTCRHTSQPEDDAAIRLNTQNETVITIQDRFLGTCTWQSNIDFGDFIIKRRDGLWAYNFATAIDDAHDFTHVLRGQDLLHTTPQQIVVMNRLGLRSPAYTHIPLLCFADGTKLSKQTHAPALNDKNPTGNIRQAYFYLGLNPPIQPHWSVHQWLSWGLEHWNLAKIPEKLPTFQEVHQ